MKYCSVYGLMVLSWRLGSLYKMGRADAQANGTWDFFF